MIASASRLGTWGQRTLTRVIPLLLLVAACDAGSAVDPSPPTPPTPSVGPRVGDVLSVNVNSMETCTNARMKGTRVVAVGARSLILADTLNPSGGFTTADFERFAARFDTLVYPTAVANFGEPTDIDTNGRIVIVFTRAVNELTPPKSGQYVGGFAYSRDLFPRAGGVRTGPCAGSNQGEFFYALAPDPAGAVNGNTFTKAFVDSATTVLLIHELEHIINASRRLYVTNAPAFEATWLDEGLAHIAEELLFYRMAGETPRRNLDLAGMQVSAARRTAFNTAMPGNATRYRAALQARATTSPYRNDDSLATRGAAWNFLRYAVDRQQGGSRATGGAVGSSFGPAMIRGGAGDLVLPSSAAGAEYLITVTNTSIRNEPASAFVLRSTGGTGASASLVAGAPQASLGGLDAGPTLAAAQVFAERRDGRQLDRGWEHRLRLRERALDRAAMAGARAWYRERPARALSPVAPGPLSHSATYSVGGAANEDASIWMRFLNSPDTGVVNLQGVLGSDVSMPQYVRDWNVSHAVDDIAPVDAAFLQPSWNWHSIYPALTVGSSPYPLTIHPLSAAMPLAGTLVPGGASYARVVLGAVAGAVVSLSGSVGSVSAVAVRVR